MFSLPVLTLKLQKPLFFVNSSGVAREAAVRTEDAVTGNDYRNGVAPHRSPDGLRGPDSELFCQLSVGGSFTVSS